MIVAGKRVVLNIGSQTIDTVLQSDGLIEVELNNNDALTGSVDLYLKAGDTAPTKSFAVQIGNLDPIETCFQACRDVVICWGLIAARLMASWEKKHALV